MTSPKSLDSYPPAFALAVARAFDKGEFIIPARTVKPLTLRMQFYGYLRALKSAGQGEMAASIYIQETPDGITLMHREKAPGVSDIMAALGDEPQNDGSFFDKL